jgi:hypothetical protein
MKLSAESVIALLLCCAGTTMLAGTTARAQLATRGPNSLTLTPLTRGNQDAPGPCICPCGGEFQCDKGQWTYCVCRDGKCTGTCSSEKKEPMDLAADVVSVIVVRTLKATDLRKEPGTYSPILDELLNGKVAEGRYRLKYRDREMGFSFTKLAVSLLTKALADLQKPVAMALITKPHHV